MKYTFLTLLILIASLTCFGQSLFFDNLNGSTWTSPTNISVEALESNKEIPLTKWIYSRDSINKELTIWIFRDSVLTIVKYSFQQRFESFVGKYHYTVNDHGVLQIILQDQTAFGYKVGIVSNGSYVVLYRAKDNRRRIKKRNTHT